MVLDELNQFVWPGYDIRPIPGSADKFDYGFLPPDLFEKIKQGILAVDKKKRATIPR